MKTFSQSFIVRQTFIEYTGHIFAGKPFYLLGGGYLKIIVSADELAEVVKGCDIICPI